MNIYEIKTESAEGLLGDFEIASDPLPGADAALQELEASLKMGAVARTRAVEQTLLALIQKAPRESFLLSAAIEFLRACIDRGLLSDTYTFSHFELFLNQYSRLSQVENRQVRGKLCGQFIPREEYQVFFPVGGGRVHAGSHYVTAHAPPDIDTAVASFWGFVDAFGAQVSEHLHIWNLPGGFPSPGIQRAFLPFFGKSLFEILPRSSKSLDVAALDLVGQGGLELKEGGEATQNLDHQRTKRLIALIDAEGFYLGSWRSSDVEGFRLVSFLVEQLFQWLTSTVTVQLASLFAQPIVKREELCTFFQTLMEMKLFGASPLRELGEVQRILLDRTLQEVCHLSVGLEASVGELTEAFEGMQGTRTLLNGLINSSLFDAEGNLIEDRPALFAELGKVIQALTDALESGRHSFDRLATAIEVKHRVYGEALQYVPVRGGLEEITEAIGDHHFLVVAEAAEGERLVPLGVIEGVDLHRKVLGTVSLRDFCNRDEVKIPPYLEIISVVDHHRTSLQTSSFPTAILGDAGSCNVLLAEQAFLLNDRYGSPLRLTKDQAGPCAIRSQQRTLARELAAISRGPHYVHPKREFAEYLSFLYAILDDTDLLDRVTARDVVCVAQLLNRLKSLSLGQDVEVVEFDDLPRDETFPKALARRLLQNKELYSLYLRVFEQRKEEVERDLTMCARGESSDVFADTKEQAGGARVGQTKIFADNHPVFVKYASEIRSAWMAKAQQIYRDQPTCDLHLQMVSTMAGAEEVHTASPADYSHQDELWIWVPGTEEGRVKLAGYLSLFKKAPELAGRSIEIELIGEETGALAKLFSYHFKHAEVKKKKGESSVTVVRYPAGTINSRKTSITPYLPA